MKIFEPEHRILTLEQALKEGKEIVFPIEKHKYSCDINIDRIEYRKIIKQMYKKGLVVGVKK